MCSFLYQLLILYVGYLHCYMVQECPQQRSLYHGIKNNFPPHTANNEDDVNSKYSNQSKNLAPGSVQNTSVTIINHAQLLNYNINIASQDSFIQIKSSSTGEKLLTSVSNLMNTSYNSLGTNNRKFNLTNLLLDKSEQLLNQLTQNDLNDEGIHRIVKPNLFYQISDPLYGNITGIALFKPNHSNSATFTEYTFKPLFSNTSLDDLISENFEIAAFVPQQLLNDIRNDSSSSAIRISLLFYYNDYLFVDNNENNVTVASKVVSFSIHGYENCFRSPVKLLVKQSMKPKQMDVDCGYWDFGSVTDTNSKWTVDTGVRKNTIGNYQICEYFHLTHLALLVQSSNQTKEDPLETKFLDLTTLFGFVLSIIGIMGIFITAIVFKTWRQDVKIKVLLNVSICILLQIIMLYIADMNNFEKSKHVCTLVAGLLQYLVLCGFSWSMVSAYIQYLRFMRIVGGKPSHLLLKGSLVGWITPGFIVVIPLLMDTCNFLPSPDHSGSSFCFPQGMILYLTVFLPITCVIIVNFTMYCLILYNISKSKQQISASNRNVLEHQLKRAILLFFMFGMPWIFGLLAASDHCTACLYLFCATATLQGFVQFVFSVLLDLRTRGLWISWYKTKASGKNVNVNLEKNCHDVVKAHISGQCTGVDLLKITKIDADDSYV